MKIKILLIVLVLINVSCKEKNFKKENIEINSIKKDTISYKKLFDELESISLPFCIENPINESNYYYYEIDTFLLHHRLQKNINPLINNKFHKKTEDFIPEKEETFIVYPYEEEKEDSPPFAIKKVKINENIIGVFYAYVKISDILMPRIELQTFDTRWNNIDNLIVSYGFIDECSGFRNFCINENYIIKVYTDFGCHPEVNEGIEFSFKDISIFKINKEGKFIKQ